MRLLIDGCQNELRDSVVAALRAADPRQAKSHVLARARIVDGLTRSALLMARLNLVEALATLEVAGEHERRWLPAGSPTR